MTLVSERANLAVQRRFTVEGADPFADVEWELRDARLIDHRDGSVTFEQLGVEVPRSWSQNATNILAQKYFRGTLGTSERESSLRQVVSRIVDTITAWGERDGYFADAAEAECFRAELVHLLVNQKAAFNSPVWFNIGVEGVPQQASACFILSVDDNMESILNWYAEEGRIFKGGSGAGVNLSRIRASSEGLGGGGTASGPVSFMRGADASAGTIKSGGKTRRAAKMVILDADHPDVEEFIWCKAREERKAHALEAAGFDMTLDGADIHSVQYQNANNSVRVTDEFMAAVVDDSDWALTARGDGSVTRTVKARALLRQIAQASWECADPGIQFDSTINRWNTAANTGRINASNPCSEYLHIDDSACNLASLNLLAFHSGDGVDGFDVEGFAHAVRIVFTAQEILVANADYPTERIGDNARDFRQLGLGYANLGALLMTLGMPYDSAQGRAVAASVTALMTAEAYMQSARLAARMGPFSGFDENREHMLRVLDQHRAAVADVDEQQAPPRILDAARLAWDRVCESAADAGVRNAQATVLAPTGTIGLLMDCDTTGVEPDLGLVKLKRLVGGGTMSLINQSVPRALRNLGYSPDAVEAIIDHINTHHSAVGAPGLDPKDLAVFACSLGSDAIHYLGHLKMMGAVQPFISGAISKTVNLPEEATVGEIESLLIESWRMGLKAVALYRDNCKVSQPLVSRDAASNRSGNAPEPTVPEASAELTLDGWNNATQQAAPTVPPSPHQPSPRQPDPRQPSPHQRSAGRAGSAVAAPLNQPVRERLPRTRTSRTFEFRVADCKGFVTVGEYDDNRPGEIFVRVSKQGSTLAGIMDAFAVSLSHGLQYGVPLSAFVRTFVGMRFEPAGMTDDPEIRIATSLMDYLFRRLAVMYLSDEERSSLGILTTDERTQPTLPGVEEQVTKTVQGSDIPPHRSAPPPAAQLSFEVEGSSGAPFCMSCGVPMQRAGACFVCGACGTTSGCS
ncbi:MAG: vitamin B12-dependent ribonucleotide reductase [Acidimicrobiaceae bacterium]|nr:vitamin B12-dependent ribonucleotide reductase [Acidimicrobiia bacterium]MCY4493960.1 vitamin B12-dependent ribonucleotide reductase [Acidimicrobiaceae bacterium]